jgi:unsaturated rhamnogalacturonyl hydrolase
MAPFLTLAYMYERTKGTNYLAYLDSWGEWAMYELARTKHGGMQHITYVEENKDQLWDDTLMMTVLLLTKIGLVLNRPH